VLLGVIPLTIVMVISSTLAIRRGLLASRLFKVLSSSLDSRLRHLALRLRVLVVFVVLVLGFVDERSDEVQNPVSYVRTKTPRRKQAKEYGNSRANNSRNESPPRQTAVRLARNNMTSEPKSSPILFATRPTGAAVRPSEDRDSDESGDKAEVQEHQRPADQLRFVLQEAAEQHGDEGVEDCGGEDPGDGAVGGCEAAALLDDLDEAGGEEADGDDRGDELEEAQDALEQEVGSGFAEAFVGALDTHRRWSGEVRFGLVGLFRRCRCGW
jgi:hypothetical protein